MGDNGKLYTTYTTEMKDKMHLLVEKADVITPNMTEACFLLGEDYTNEPMDTALIKEYLKRLSEQGPEMVVITGVEAENGCHLNVGYTRYQDTYWRVPYDCIPAQYPGTGDTFASVLTGGSLRGDSLPIAIERATQFVSMAIRVTYGYRTPEREGIMLEKVLGLLKSELIYSGYEKF
jgi:pyridoxine kinase